MVLINKTCLLNHGYKIDWSQIILILELILPITLILSKSFSFCTGQMKCMKWSLKSLPAVKFCSSVGYFKIQFRTESDALGSFSFLPPFSD